jgi:hypothetical protein
MRPDLCRAVAAPHCATLVALALALAACGGKIAPDPIPDVGSVAPEPAPGSQASERSQPPEGVPSALSVEAVCAAICDRDGRCGADNGTCRERCSAKLTIGTCAPSADAYLQCWVVNLQPGCGELPPACEDAYCTYTSCAGIVAPPYCR